MFKFLLIGVFLCTHLSGFGDDLISFNEHIRPILSDKCFHCHGPDEKHIKGKLQLHTFEKATAGLGKKKNRFALVPGRPDKSSVWERISTDDEDDIMPPAESHKTLSKKEKELIKKWISSGAEYQKHWSFEKITSPAITDNSSHPIDYLVLNKLRKNNLSMNTPADKRTLIRRLALDLTGLPPSKETLERFLTDNSPNAYEKLVDSFLASPRYGEHMARYWLDVVRYGDTHGLHGDNYREMYMYRDWVIKSFNANKSFDQFTVEQVAGDMLEKPSLDQLIASGFNRLHISNSAGSALEEELYVNNVNDRVSAIGTVFMGLTLGCAACHDHKFDPISQKEYYQIFAFFNNLDGPSHNSGVKSPKPRLQFPSPKQESELKDLKAKMASEKDKKKLNAIQAQVKKLESQIPSTLIFKERTTERPAFILNRGQYDQASDKVSRKTLAALPPMDPKLPLNRLGFANWLVSPEHPLTSRVVVNRFWQQIFGVGLVKTAEDFGSQGQYPSHPKLLDFLASKFVKEGWNVKELMKFIVTSKAYKQSSKADNSLYIQDPENRLLARGPRFRMDAEMLRDQALFISGKLVTNMYGKSVKPPQPAGLWKSVALKGSNTGTFKQDTGSDIYRRSIYTFWKRALPPPTMTIFNAPTRENCTARRERTNTPIQALVLMNEKQFFEASVNLAKLTLKHGGSTDLERLKYLYEKMTGHIPDPNEMQILKESLMAFHELCKNEKVTILAGEKIYLETAAWAMLSNSLMSLDKFKSKE
ncbi:MAG: PSD1 and planctomycete cytochrome C domain-containing protein [Lentisphaeraceae bacterium]|nr:PSD1 and planctomycete cytochrome C domain-containing protein [Lentisphaeraceae bacterium]